MARYMLLLTLLCLVATTQATSSSESSSDESDSDEAGECYWMGQTYAVGAQAPAPVDDPCVRCQCMGGDSPQVACVSVMCDRLRCVDPEDVPGACCATCPNGE